MVEVAIDVVRDGSPDADVVDGALTALDEHPDLCLALVGPEQVLAGLVGDRERARIVDARGAILADDDPVVAARARQDASVRVALDEVAAGRAAGLVSTGPVGATLAAAQFRLGRQPGARFAALATTVQAPGGPLLVIDAGAGPAVPAGTLAGFVASGVDLARRLGIDQPRAGIHVPVPPAGNTLQEAAAMAGAHTLSGGRYVGTVTTTAALSGAVDLLVTFGATGRTLVDTVRRLTGPDAVSAGIVLGVKGTVVAVEEPARDGTTSGIALATGLISRPRA